jgi:fucose 4-O-acetylase-like acetyltransferase
MPTSSLSARLTWIDCAKGIGIILVVYGHLAMSAMNAGATLPLHAMSVSENIVYSFHMPLFFILAGLVVARSYRRRGTHRFLIDKLQYLAYPYLVWSILQTGSEILFHGASNHSTSPLDLWLLPVLPHEQFWFLYALFLMYAVYAASARLGNFRLPVLVSASIVMFMIPVRIHWLALDDVCREFVFFVLGIGLSELAEQSERGLPRIPLRVTMVLSVAFAILATATLTLDPGIGKLSEEELPLRFFPLAVLGAAATVGWSQWLAERRASSVLSLLGRYSLPIFLMHMFAGVFARIVLVKLLKFPDDGVTLAFSIACALIIPIAVYTLSRRLRAPQLFHYELHAAATLSVRQRDIKARS